MPAAALACGPPTGPRAPAIHGHRQGPKMVSWRLYRLDKYVPQDEERGKEINQPVGIPGLAGGRSDNRAADEPERRTVDDAESERHRSESEGGEQEGSGRPVARLESPAPCAGSSRATHLVLAPSGAAGLRHSYRRASMGFSIAALRAG